MKFKNSYMKLVPPVLVCIVVFFAFLKGSAFLSLGGKLLHILRPFLIGGVTAYLLAPICEWIEQFFIKHTAKGEVSEKKRKSVHGLSVMITILLLLIVSYLSMAMLIPQLASSLAMLVSQLPEYVDSVYNLLDRFLQNIPSLREPIENYLQQSTADSGAIIEEVVLPQLWTVMGGLGQTLGVLKDSLIGLFAAIYILLERKTFRTQCETLARAVLRGERAEIFLREVGIFNHYMTGFIKGKLIDSLIIGIICGIGTVIMRMPYAALVSVIVGVTNVIPFFGPYFGAIPSALLILMVSPIHCVIFVVFIIILQQFDGNVLGPKILGDSTNLSAFWILFSIILFGGLFGVPGMIVGVPVFGFAGHLLRAWISGRLPDAVTPAAAANAAGASQASEAAGKTGGSDGQ